MSKEPKLSKQFVKCSSLSMYHKRKRVRKKNENRVDKLLKEQQSIENKRRNRRYKQELSKENHD